MQIPIDIIDIEPLKKRLDTLTCNNEALKAHGNNINVSEQVLKVYDLTTNFIKAVCENTLKYDLYSNSFVKKLGELIDFNVYKSGESVFIDSCLRAFTLAENLFAKE